MLERSQKPHRLFADPAPAPAPARDSATDPPTDSGSGAGAGDGGNVDRLLFKNLVEMVPLVESLMDRRANSTYSRRASMVYTPAPAKKAGDFKSGKTSQSVSAKKRRDPGDASKRSTQDSNGDSASVTSNALGAENMPKDKEELARLREQINDLQKQLLEKDESLKSAESSISQMNAAYLTIDELRNQVAERDALIKSTNLQLHNAKILLADKQASLEKLEWEVKMSNKKVEDLQGDVSSMDFEITALMTLFEKLIENDSDDYLDDSIPSSYEIEVLQFMSDIDSVETEKIEEERATYSEVLAAARANPSEDLLKLAAEARLRLQVLVL